MKTKVSTILILLIAIAFNSYGQKLEENKKDDFTGDTIKNVSWESLGISLSMDAYRYFRISKSNSNVSFELKITPFKAIVPKGSEIMFKLASGDVVTLKSMEDVESCLGCGATGYKASRTKGVYLKYLMSNEQCGKMKTDKVLKIRIYTSDGSLDWDIKDSVAKKIIKSLELI
ncbi:MAG TPA: hypothetical protein VGM63_23980 [Mucilaginibacter sp.]|jgi:hypothetical protein